MSLTAEQLATITESPFKQDFPLRRAGFGSGPARGGKKADVVNQ